MDAEEDAFWNHLEANPADSVARLVFADWLQERGDQRAEGMRVLGLLRKHPHHAGDYWYFPDNPVFGNPYAVSLPSKWWDSFHLSDFRQTLSYKLLSNCDTVACLSWLDLTKEVRDGICKLD